MGYMPYTEYYPEYCNKSVVVLGCGNILFVDDGFGPAVIDCILHSGNVPENACFLNVGTSAREVLFNIILSERKPDTIIIVDAMECNREPGTIIELSLDSIPDNKISDFSIHQTPTSNLLKELRDLCGVGVTLVVLQPVDIPPEVKPGLSRGAERAVKLAAVKIAESIRNTCST